MPFNPALPADHTQATAAEMRAQLTSLFADLQQRATLGDLGVAISGTSSNSNAVSTLSQGADGSYSQGQMQAVLDKLDELINALRR